MSDKERMQEIEQAAHTIAVQRQAIQHQLNETNSALNELGDENYKMIGNLMVKADTEKLRTELTERKGLFNKKVQALEQQEHRLREQHKQLQEEALGETDE